MPLLCFLYFALLVPTCPYLHVQGAVKQEPISYLVGSHVVITGCRSDMVLDGSTSYTCEVNSDGSTYWDPEVDVVCKGSWSNSLQNTKQLVCQKIPGEVASSYRKNTKLLLYGLKSTKHKCK